MAFYRLPLADIPDWRWQAREALRTPEQLERHLVLSDEERAGIKAASAGGFPISITPYYLSLIDPHDPNCPIRKQVVPTIGETVPIPGDLVDPLGEESHEVATGLIRRYPDRVLLLVTDRCAVYCRFCTRSRMVGDGGGALSMKSLESAFNYIENDPTIQDVIVSGGDPLVMSTSKLQPILERIADIEHVLTLRLATRAPVTLPQRIDEALCAVLKASHPAIWVMTHFNHPRELTDESTRALSLLADHGLPVMNQSVLLRGVNDDADTLESLFRGLVRRRVRPYYLLQADVVRGTGHLRTPLQRGIELMASLQGRVSGIALPKFICDTPGGYGKVPLGTQSIETTSAGITTLRTFRGDLVGYTDPPNFSSHHTHLKYSG